MRRCRTVSSRSRDFVVVSHRKILRPHEGSRPHRISAERNDKNCDAREKKKKRRNKNTRTTKIATREPFVGGAEAKPQREPLEGEVLDKDFRMPERADIPPSSPLDIG